TAGQGWQKLFLIYLAPVIFLCEATAIPKSDPCHPVTVKQICSGGISLFLRKHNISEGGSIPGERLWLGPVRYNEKIWVGIQKFI
ncbi:hypothetical protein BGX38DRAFT_1159497, partial [Terfezia claveryi]